MKRIYPQIFILLLLIIVAFIGCEDTLSVKDIDNIIIPGKNVSYSMYIQPLLTTKCSTSDCHNNVAMAGDYSVNNYSSVIMPGIVEPFSVETSRLVWRIEGQSGELMPPQLNGGLIPNQREGIKTWIREGAKNN